MSQTAFTFSYSLDWTKCAGRQLQLAWKLHGDRKVLRVGMVVCMVMV